MSAATKGKVMPNAPTVVCRVTRPISSPIRARPGEILTAWPGHPTHTLAVVSADCETVVRHVGCGEKTMRAALLRWFLDARIRPRNVAVEREILGVTDY